MANTHYSSKRGKPHKNKIELAARIDAKLRSLRLHAGTAEFDPVEMMAIIGAEAYDEGDKHLALVAFKEVSQYVRPKLASTTIEHKPESEPASKLHVLQAFQRMGVAIKTDDPTSLIREAMEHDGLTYEEAVSQVEDVTGITIDAVAIPALPGPDDDRG